MSAEPRGERLQIMLTTDELTALDQWRFSRHMPSRAAAIRELLRRGLADFPLIVRSDYIPRIQEVQASIYHVIREALEALRHG